jgi:hypothetical protein
MLAEIVTVKYGLELEECHLPGVAMVAELLLCIVYFHARLLVQCDTRSVNYRATGACNTLQKFYSSKVILHHDPKIVSYSSH